MLQVLIHGDIIFILLTLKRYYTYISTDYFLSSLPLSDWLIFCFGKSFDMLYQKEMKIVETHLFDEKQEITKKQKQNKKMTEKQLQT